MKNNIKLFFLFLTMISTMFLMSSNSWYNIWIWLEINMISFISLMINNNNKLTIESSLIYFLIQTIASILMIFSFIMMMFLKNMQILFLVSLLTKLGSCPFHYWILLMIEGLNWMKIFILLTWQKINPMIMLLYNNNNKLMNLFIFLSLIISTFSSLNYLSMKKMMALSSINQLSWIMISLNFNKILKLYLMFYFFLMWNIIKLMNFLNIKYLNQMYTMKLKNNFMKIFMFTNLMSIGGLPPFLGFFPKMMIIMKMNNYLMMFLMIIFSLIMLFTYLRMLMSMILINSLKINKIYKKINSKKIKFMMNYSLINNFLIMMIFFMF